MDLGERAHRLRFLVRGRAGQLTEAFDAVLGGAGIEVVKIPPRSQRANAVCERVIGTLRRELPDRVLILNERHLVLVLREYLTHYNRPRPRQSRRQRVPETHPSDTWPACGMSAENPSSRE